MDGWHLFLYAMAAALALQSLVSLMVHHKRQFTQKLIAEQAQRKTNATEADSKTEDGDEEEKADQVAA